MPPKRKNVEQSSDVPAGIPTGAKKGKKETEPVSNEAEEPKKADPPLDVKAEEPKDTKKGKKKAEPDVKAEEPKKADVPANGHAEEPQKEAKKGRKKAEPPVEAKAEEPPKSEAPSEATEPPKEVKKGRKKAEPASETKTEEPKKADPPSEAKPEEPKEVKKGRNKAEPTKTAEEPKKVEPVVTSEEPKEAKKGRKKADPPSEAKTEEPKKADPPSDAKTEEPKDIKRGRKKADPPSSTQAEESKKSDVPPEANVEEPKEAKKGRKKAEAKNEEPMLVDQSANAKTEQSKEANKGKKKGAKKADDDEPVTKKSKQEKNVADDVDTSFPTEINPNAKTKDGRKFNKTIVSWNVNGVRAWLEKDGISYLDKYSPDILVIQETKCSESKLPEKLKVAGYHSFFSSGDTEGYAGTALYSKEKPKEVKFGIGIEKHDQEGRVITAEYDKFYLVGAYVPNSGKGLVRLKYRTKEWDVDFRKYLKGLDAKKPVIYCGDLNVAHQEADLKNPKANKNKTAGFHDDERQGFTDLLAEGFFDSFRELYPNAVDCYSFWTYMMNSRAKNVGWRLDYFVLSNRLKKDLCDQVIQQKIMGSDHCPLVLQMHL